MYVQMHATLAQGFPCTRRKKDITVHLIGWFNNSQHLIQLRRLMYVILCPKPPQEIDMGYCWVLQVPPISYKEMG